MTKKTTLLVSGTTLLLSATLAVSWALEYHGRNAGVKAPPSAAAPTASGDMSGWHDTGEDPWQELSRVFHAMQQQFPLHASGRIQLINDENGRLLEEQPFETDCADSVHSRYKVADQEMIADGSLFVAIDHAEKFIAVSYAGKAINNGSPAEQIKQLFGRQKDSLQVMANDRGERMLYSPEFSGNGLSMLKLYYKPDTYLIRKMVMYQLAMGSRQDNPGAAIQDTATPQATAMTPYHVNRMEFVYDVLRRDNAAGNLHYDDPYIRVNGTDVALRSAYNDYHLVSTLKHQPSK
jgi:hypothetical protein